MPSVAASMLEELREPTMTDVSLARRKKQMEREILERKLNAFDESKQKMQDEIAKAASPTGYKLDGRPMMDKAGRTLLNPTDAARQELAKDPYQQLNLLLQGAAQFDTYKQPIALFNEAAPGEDEVRKLKEKAIGDRAQDNALLEFQTRLRLRDLLGNRGL